MVQVPFRIQMENVINATLDLKELLAWIPSRLKRRALELVVYVTNLQIQGGRVLLKIDVIVVHQAMVEQILLILQLLVKDV